MSAVGNVKQVAGLSKGIGFILLLGPFGKFSHFISDLMFGFSQFRALVLIGFCSVSAPCFHELRFFWGAL